MISRSSHFTREIHYEQYNSKQRKKELKERSHKVLEDFVRRERKLAAKGFGKDFMKEAELKLSLEER